MKRQWSNFTTCLGRDRSLYPSAYIKFEIDHSKYTHSCIWFYRSSAPPFFYFSYFRCFAKVSRIAREEHLSNGIDGFSIYREPVNPSLFESEEAWLQSHGVGRMNAARYDQWFFTMSFHVDGSKVYSEWGNTANTMNRKRIFARQIALLGGELHGRIFCPARNKVM